MEVVRNCHHSPYCQFRRLQFRRHMGLDFEFALQSLRRFAN
jgi:hypothetical protein